MFDTNLQRSYANPVAHIGGAGLTSRKTHGIGRFMRFFYATTFRFDYVGLSEAAERLAGRESGMSTSFSPAPTLDIVLPGNLLTHGALS